MWLFTGQIRFRGPRAVCMNFDNQTLKRTKTHNCTSEGSLVMTTKRIEFYSISIVFFYYKIQKSNNMYCSKYALLMPDFSKGRFIEQGHMIVYH